MKLADYVPGPAEISREAITLIAGALLAGLILSQLPGVKAWLANAWGTDPRNLTYH